jgi:Outer membrane lipoprotein-sorting protein
MDKIVSPGRRLPRLLRISLVTLAALIARPAPATLDRHLPYPTGIPNAEEVARQVYFANHFYGFKNFSIRRQGRTMAVLITRNGDGSTIRAGLERHLNNNYDDGGTIRARDLAIFHSGIMRGTGILVTEYRDPSKSNSYDIWLPDLRKVRRFAEPDQSEAWGGSVFTFGDVSLRRPEDETHQILGRKPFRTCLGVIDELEGKPYIHVGRLPQRTCRHIGKDVYILKSTTKLPNWWYDYRISFVDTKTFADYRTVYFKNGQMIKIIDRDWGVVSGANKADPRALFWKYWYGADLVGNRESWAVVPQAVIQYDTGKSSYYWTEQTLRRLHN